MTIEQNLLAIKRTLPSSVKLIAVSKTKPAEQLMEAYQAGQRCFGENKVQEMVAKHEELPQDIEWHLIGHLQTNKMKYIAPFVAMIHAVDSLKLLKTINSEAHKCNRTIPCLLQFHIAKEESKFGLTLHEAEALIQSPEFGELKNIRIDGLMGMATFTDDQQVIASEFETLRLIFQHLKARYFAENDNFREISMGMSDDYLIAISHGSTMVRIGSSIFGERNY